MVFLANCMRLHVTSNDLTAWFFWNCTIANPNQITNSDHLGFKGPNRGQIVQPYQILQARSQKRMHNFSKGKIVIENGVNNL